MTPRMCNHGEKHMFPPSTLAYNQGPWTHVRYLLVFVSSTVRKLTPINETTKQGSDPSAHTRHGNDPTCPISIFQPEFGWVMQEQRCAKERFAPKQSVP